MTPKDLHIAICGLIERPIVSETTCRLLFQFYTCSIDTAQEVAVVDAVRLKNSLRKFPTMKKAWLWLDFVCYELLGRFCVVPVLSWQVSAPLWEVSQLQLRYSASKTCLRSFVRQLPALRTGNHDKRIQTHDFVDENEDRAL